MSYSFVDLILRDQDDVTGGSSAGHADHSRTEPAAVLLLEVVGELTSVPLLRRQAWAAAISARFDPDMVVSPGNPDIDPEVLFISLHAVDALCRVTPGVEPLRVTVPVNPLAAIQSLPWVDSLASAAWVRCILLALLQQAEGDGQGDASEHVRRVTAWLEGEQGEGCYLVPDRSGDALKALCSTSAIAPFFTYTFRPTTRNTSRAEMALAALRREQLSEDPIGQTVSGLLRLLCINHEVASVLPEADAVLREARHHLAVWLEKELPSAEQAGTEAFMGWTTRAWAAASLLAEVDAALGLAASWSYRRWPGPGYRRPSVKLTADEHISARAWLMPPDLDVPQSREAVVSVVVPCYNLGAFLPEALQSINQQTLRDVAVIIVDDGSTDELTQIALELARERGALVVTQANSGLAAARNRGVQASGSPYICCLDADDRLRPEFLEKSVRYLQQHPDAAFVTTWCQLFGESDLLVTDLKPDLPNMLALNQTICSAVFRKEIWRDVGGFKGGFSHPGIEDWDFWLAILERGHEGAILPEVLFEYRIRKDSMSERMYTPERWTSLIEELIRRHPEAFRQHWDFVVAKLHSHRIEQQAWFAKRERVIRWWRSQAGHLTDTVDQLQTLTKERSDWISELEAAKEWLAAQVNTWQELAKAREAECDALRREVAELQRQRSVLEADGIAQRPRDAESAPPWPAAGISLVQAFPKRADLERSLRLMRTGPTPQRLLASPPTAPHETHSLPAHALQADAHRPPASVCIATPDIVGPVRTGGIGTAYTSLALALRGAGHQVTILYTRGTYCENGTIEDWRGYYSVRGIDFAPLPDLDVPVDGPSEWGASYATYAWLKGRTFDVVHFPEMFGVGAFSVEAKRLGLAFGKTTLCVGLHSPTIWHRLENRQRVERIDDLILDALERKSVELADVLVSPSRYLLDWVDRAGWRRPERTYVHPYAVEALQYRGHSIGTADEIVFFGRLESRKGLELFCDAVELLLREDGSLPTQITFLGKSGLVGNVDGEAYVARRARRWPTRTEIHTDLSREDALAYLTQSSALAVMPSLSDNTPNTVIECLRTSVPFISTRVGGIPEMIAAADHDRVLVEPDASALAAAIRKARTEGHPPAQPAVASDTVNLRWVEWHSALTETAKDTPREPDRTPLVSVCIATRNRPGLLAQALTSIASQTYASLEVVVVDDGSDNPDEVAVVIDESTRNGLNAPVRLVAERQRFPGAARNTAATHAKGEYILFMDDDNLALPHEVSTLVSAALHAGMDIVTCGFRAFQHVSDTVTERHPQFLWLPIGPAMPLGLLMNSFGDTNMLIRREAFFRVGGFDEERGAGLSEDWIFHSRAFLAGMRAAAVPEPLFEYRRWPGGSGQGGARYLSYVRTLQPYLQQLDPSFGLLLLYASGNFRAIADKVDDGPETEAAPSFETAVPIARLARRDLTIHAQASWIDADSAVALRADGTDPQILLPRISLSDPAPLLVRVDITPPRATVLQMFWIRDEDPNHYDEDRSVMLPIRGTRSIVVLKIPTGNLAAPLRLDPGFVKGTYIIHDLEIRQAHVGEADAGTAEGGTVRPFSRAALRRVLRRLRRRLWD